MPYILHVTNFTSCAIYKIIKEKKILFLREEFYCVSHKLYYCTYRLKHLTYFFNL